MGDLSGFGDLPRPPLRARTFKIIDFDNFNQVMEELNPRAVFKISSSAIPGQIDINLVFRSIEDFEPESLVHRVPLLASLKNSREPEAAQQLALYLDLILHAPEFQQLEATWRALWYFVSRTESSSQMLIKFVDVTKRELAKDLLRAPEPDQSWLFKAVYEEPYGQFAAPPFGLLVGNFDFGPSPDDVELLDKLGTVANLCHAPFIAGAAPQILGLENFSEMANPRDLLKIVESEQYARWRAFRETENARYVALALPRMLLRSPYGMRPDVLGEYHHVEEVRSSENLLWGNAAFAFATCVANAFTRYGWCGAIRGVEGGGLVEGLPTWVSQEEERDLRSGIEAMITDRREKELADLGFLPLVQIKNTDLAVFFTASSCCRPKRYDNDAASANSRLMCQLSYVLTGARFMHYVKVIARDRIGSYTTRGQWERQLNRWVASYVTSDDQASPAIRAKFPLREARIDVAEDPGKPGSYRVVAFLRPYFQLEELSVSLRIVGRIP
jgi:type VI secretion system protein ImpC